MPKFGAIGSGFSHSPGGTTGKETEYIDWRYNEEEDVEYIFFIDGRIRNGVRRNDIDPKRKCAWILESRPIIPDVYDFVKSNLDAISRVYKYIFTHDRQILDRVDNARFVPGMGHYVEQPKLYEKSKLACMVTSTKSTTSGHKRRLEWAKRLEDELDLYGRGIDPIDLKEDALADYMFSIEVENSQYETYFTEKLHDALACGTIPVYRGAPDVGRWYNEDGIIELEDDFGVEDLSGELYYSKIDAVKDNFERVKKFEVIEDFMYEEYFQ